MVNVFLFWRVAVNGPKPPLAVSVPGSATMRMGCEMVEMSVVSEPLTEYVRKRASTESGKFVGVM